MFFKTNETLLKLRSVRSFALWWIMLHVPKPIITLKDIRKSEELSWVICGRPPPWVFPPYLLGPLGRHGGAFGRLWGAVGRLLVAVGSPWGRLWEALGTWPPQASKNSRKRGGHTTVVKSWVSGFFGTCFPRRPCAGPGGVRGEH